LSLKKVLLCGILLWSFVGCALHRFPEGNRNLPYPSRGVRENTIVHVRTGYRLDPEQFFEFLRGTRVVYLAEIHNSPGVHRMQAEVIRGLAERFPGRVSVGMEMFPYTAQKALDRWYRENNRSDKEFRKLWKAYWGEKIDYYRPVLKVLKQKKIPILGLNAPKSAVLKIARNGLENLPKTFRDSLPEIDLSDPYERRYLASVFKGHPQGRGMLDRFFLVQAFWEETMAETAAAYLQSAQGRSKILIILAGENHVDYGFGIPRRLFRRLPVSYVTVQPKILAIEQIPKSQFMKVKEPPLPLRVADFYWYVYFQ